MKKCNKCEETDLSKFGKHKNQSDGLQSTCKKCCNNTNKKYRTKNKEKIKVINKIWHLSNKKQRKEYCKNWTKINPINGKAHNLKKYWPNSTTEQVLSYYNQLFLKQEGRCAICTKHQSEFKKALHVDHDHKTSKVRGLLCTRCNPGIGYLQNSPTICKAAYEYLLSFV